jgi:predicted nucleic acid-binding Zn ribbon protein
VNKLLVGSGWYRSDSRSDLIPHQSRKRRGLRLARRG